MFLEIFLPILFYCLIGAIIEFLLVFGVLIYAKRHSKSDEQFIEAWNKASDVALVISLSHSNDITNDVAFALRLHVCAVTFIWPFHLVMHVLINACNIVSRVSNRFFSKVASVLVKR